MASNTLTFDLILQYFLDCGGSVRNKDAVTKFRKYLTHPECKEESRQKFREYVNVLAHSKVINGEKILLLKSKYMRNYEYPPAPALNVMHSISPPLDPRNSLGIPLSPTHSIDLSSSSVNLSPRQPPPYRPPPPVSSPSPSLDNVSLASFNSSLNNDSFAPQPPPRKRSMDIHRSLSSSLSEVDLNHNRGASDSVKDEKEPISVKERTQKFNRLASVEDELNPSPRPRKSTETKPKLEGEDNEDVASIASLEPKKCVEWYVTASKGDFQELIKLAKDEPRLVHKKDPFTAYTVLHWGAKHGNSEIIKHFAGHHKVDVNGRTNGGYTPLHIAAQFGHKDVFKLLIEVYKANQNLRDYSGRTPEYYFLEKTIIGSKKNLRSEYNTTPRKHAKSLTRSFRQKATRSLQFPPKHQSTKSLHLPKQSVDFGSKSFISYPTLHK